MMQAWPFNKLEYAPIHQRRFFPGDLSIILRLEVRQRLYFLCPGKLLGDSCWALDCGLWVPAKEKIQKNK